MIEAPGPLRHCDLGHLTYRFWYGCDPHRFDILDQLSDPASPAVRFILEEP